MAAQAREALTRRARDSDGDAAVASLEFFSLPIVGRSLGSRVALGPSSGSNKKKGLTTGAVVF